MATTDANGSKSDELEKAVEVGKEERLSSVSFSLAIQKVNMRKDICRDFAVKHLLSVSFFFPPFSVHLSGHQEGVLDQ